MLISWRLWGVAASIIWALVGGNAGVHLAVAPAISAYQACVQGQGAHGRECQINLHRDWAEQSGRRLSYAIMIGLVPIPVAWVIVLCGLALATAFTSIHPRTRGLNNARGRAGYGTCIPSARTISAMGLGRVKTRLREGRLEWIFLRIATGS